ncbi:MAG: MaoC family dehydratase [Chloroflexi bacterium]|nr:MaoC family dehydratase [Chloroflexota bacterium]
MPEITPRLDFQIGEKAEFSKTITESDVVMYAGLSGDFNPLHVDEEYAKTSRFGGRIAHGLLTTGLISAVVGMKLPGPGAIYLSQQLKFTGPVRIGDTITAVAQVAGWLPEKRIVTLKTDCFNQRGEQVIAGEAALLVEPAAG